MDFTVRCVAVPQSHGKSPEQHATGQRVHLIAVRPARTARHDAVPALYARLFLHVDRRIGDLRSIAAHSDKNAKRAGQRSVSSFHSAS